MFAVNTVTALNLEGILGVLWQIFDTGVMEFVDAVITWLWLAPTYVPGMGGGGLQPGETPALGSFVHAAIGVNRPDHPGGLTRPFNRAAQIHQSAALGIGR